MFLLGFRKKLTALALGKSIESAIQRFQIHHRITLICNQNIIKSKGKHFPALVPRLYFTGLNRGFMDFSK